MAANTMPGQGPTMDMYSLLAKFWRQCSQKLNISS